MLLNVNVRDRLGRSDLLEIWIEGSSDGMTWTPVVPAQSFGDGHTSVNHEDPRECPDRLCIVLAPGLDLY